MVASFHAPKAYKKRAASAPGFTIVELLIVVVVIAILAAITIVSYNGIQDRARSASAQTAVRNVYTALKTYAIENSESYPATLSAIGVEDSDGISYQYSYDNSTSPATFCVTASAQNKSSYISSTDDMLQDGGCAGHSANGVTAITNFVKVPITTQAVAWRSESGDGTITRSWPTSGGPTDGAFIRSTVDTVKTSGVYVHGPYFDQSAALTSGTTYTWSIWVRVSEAIGGVTAVVYLNPGNVYATTDCSAVPLVANVWTRISCTFTPTFDATGFFGQARTSQVLSVGSTYDATMPMMVEGTTSPAYADGNSSGWVWNGTQNASTSTGLPL